jgi:hypothetical protein
MTMHAIGRQVRALLVLSVACLILAGMPMTTQAAGSAGRVARDATNLSPEPTPPSTLLPVESPGLSPLPAGAIPVPEQTSVTVGYSDTSFVGRIAMVLADTRGYFTDAGFQQVTFMYVEAPLPGLLNGSLDFAILDDSEAATGFSLGLPVRAVAGHRIGAPAKVATASAPASSPQGFTDPGADKRDVLATTSDMIAGRPTTVTAFTAAYTRALQDLRTRLDAGSTSTATGPDDDALFQAATGAGIDIPDSLRAAWPQPLAVLSPDGGFGPLADDGGLGELRASVSGDPVALGALDGLLWTDGLHVAQRWLGLPENPSLVPGTSAGAMPSADASAAP